MSVTFQEALKVWARIGCLSFGGPAGQIALMHRELVDERQWLTEKEFLSALNFCMLLPGPEAMQLATYAGWKMHGVKGGLAAGLLFVLPGAFVVLALSMTYGAYGNLPLMEALFFGIKAAVLAIVLEALLRVTKKALKSSADYVIAAAAFVALFVFNVPFPLVIIAAGLYGFFRSRGGATASYTALPPLSHLFKTVAIWGAVWLVPLALLWALAGQNHVLTELGLFFSKLAMVTFGGAYAVLSYMAQAVVEQKQWLTGPEMMDGLGLAETTPGPLILVTEYVGYLSALRQTGSVWGGIAGAVVALWMTFAPCFLWIFAGAPYIEAIGKRPRLSSALSAITAAVVGVILNLTMWFGLHVLFGNATRLPGLIQPWIPDWSNFSVQAFLLAVAAIISLHVFNRGVPFTLVICGLAGITFTLL